ncbi:MAG: tyrosine--tRNA ligase [Alphaproteobacteria bacterium RIFCSPLOWO2_01_FULL_40_26]|nr:MAG: tyrosine--tRNA ligase [Alphaproteobacteria bacterium RIFCSPLOWO2_01_FULL_40_26]OFX09691.1 MAG: tyrosine--tRNA ligase [Alphaproteobacteria bacterium RIFCSPLOWO2_02_FULL_40_19]OFX10840.1 MAG: tyrosine--tRNA ligase [Alphaproteobacteria bacterium RIFCSPLOWO2_12_FULL_40_11]
MTYDLRLKFKSDFLQEFSARGFFANCTHAKELDEILCGEKIIAYIGFDCTARSLHAGSLIQIMILRLLQKHGHKPIILLGGGTTKIGDPSGKDEARQVLSDEQIAENLHGIRKTLEKFITFGASGSNAMLVNNDDWLHHLNYIDFLRDVGRHFSVNRMLTFDSVKLRLEREQPLSFLEFNYMILQAYDFFELNKKYGCTLQIGGSDQWGNIINGIELIRRISGKESFGLISSLLTTEGGKKMGKSADGAIWLDSDMLSPFDYFQYFRNVHDADVERFLKLFTDLSLCEIEKLKNQNINEAKKILAFETTKICHGEKIAEEVLQKANEVFEKKNSDFFETITVAKNTKLVDVLIGTNLYASKSEVKRLIQGKAIKINGEKLMDENFCFTNSGEFEVSAGKKNFFRIVIK